MYIVILSKPLKLLVSKYESIDFIENYTLAYEVVEMINID